MIKQYVDLSFTINEKSQTQRLFLTVLGKQRIILGFPWLQKQNPIINWRTGEFHWQTCVPDMKKIHRLSEQQWKNEQEPGELKEIPIKEMKERDLQQWKKEKGKRKKEKGKRKKEKETRELNKIPVEENKDSQQVLKQ